MKNLAMLIISVMMSLAVMAGEPNTKSEGKPMSQIGGGYVTGNLRTIGTGPKSTVVTCEKSTKVCMYILKKIDADPNTDQCLVAQNWTPPLTVQAQFDQNYPYAFSFNTPVLTFYPATSIVIGCPDGQQNVTITIETEATITTP